MWVFDGEQWVQEGAGEAKPVSNVPDELEIGRLLPELQIVEVPRTRTEREIPFPFVIP